MAARHDHQVGFEKIVGKLELKQIRPSTLEHILKHLNELELNNKATKRI